MKICVNFIDLNFCLSLQIYFNFLSTKNLCDDMIKITQIESLSFCITQICRLHKLV
jgi:hypothetical protein